MGEETSMAPIKRRKSIAIIKVKNGYIVDCDYPTKMIANTIPDVLELVKKEFEKERES